MVICRAGQAAGGTLAVLASILPIDSVYGLIAAPTCESQHVLVGGDDASVGQECFRLLLIHFQDILKR